MKRRSLMVTMAIAGLMVLGSAVSFAQEAGKIRIAVNARHEIQYVSGKTVYVEALQHSRWVGRYWSADGQIDPTKFWSGDDAFKIHVKNHPTPPAIPGTSLSMGWQWVSSSESPGSHPRTRDAVVELYSLIYPIDLKIHTLLDGTPILTRWLEITNKSSSPMALTGLSPWSGRLWDKDTAITLGHSMRWDDQW
ncbi:MAG TPA: hypothetical protein VFZ27_16230, partial [Terriglobia bacterium]|nr:hypothetical protein [Terriglobia bacterium]